MVLCPIPRRSILEASCPGAMCPKEEYKQRCAKTAASAARASGSESWVWVWTPNHCNCCALGSFVVLRAQAWKHGSLDAKSRNLETENGKATGDKAARAAVMGTPWRTTVCSRAPCQSGYQGSAIVSVLWRFAFGTHAC